MSIITEPAKIRTCPGWCTDCVPGTDLPLCSAVHTHVVYRSASVEIKVTAAGPDEDGEMERPSIYVRDLGGIDQLTSSEALLCAAALRRAAEQLREIERGESL